MNKLKYLIILLAFVSCKRGHKADNNNLNSISNTELNYEVLQRKITDFKTKLDKESCDYKSLQKQLTTNKRLGLASIPINENIIKHCIGSLNKLDKQSIFNQFNRTMYEVIEKFNDTLELKYPKILKKFQDEMIDNETKEFNKSIDLCGLTLLMSEGTYYADVKSDYIYNLFKGKISPELDEYLKIRSKELKQGFSEDAGLLISFDELYERVITWEDFDKKYTDFFLKGNAKQYYINYFSAFLTGMDNTSAFDLETQVLTPELKSKFEKIIAQKDARKSTAMVAKYYEYLKTNDFKLPDNLNKFLEDNGLYSMLGVQPETR